MNRENGSRYFFKLILKLLKQNIEVITMMIKEAIFIPKESEKREKTENIKTMENKTVRK
jgi:uncharacterized protein (DUF2344 family)